MNEINEVHISVSIVYTYIAAKMSQDQYCALNEKTSSWHPASPTGYLWSVNIYRETAVTI